MKKRIFSVLTALALCMTLLPITALAIDSTKPTYTETTIGTTTLTSGTYYLIGDNGQLSIESASASNYNVYYNTDDTGAPSLTLNNATLKSPIYASGGTTVTLMGENKLGSETNTVSVGIQTISAATGNTALTVKGEGSLTICCLNEGITDGVYSDKNISIEGGIIRITNTQSSPIYSRNGSITISGNANVTANSGNSSISCKKDLTITGNAVVNVTNRASALSSSAKIVISGNAQVTATSTVACPLEGDDGLEILGSATVTATGETGALNSFSGDILIEGTATATLTGQPVSVAGGLNGGAAVSVGTGANSTGSITVKGKLTVTSKFAGIWTVGTGDITIDGGEVSVNALYGIMTRMGTYADATGGNVTIKNSGTLTINGAMGTYPQASNCTLKVDNSTVNTTTSSWGLYWPGQIVLKNSTVTCANSGSDNKAIGTAKNIQYDYTDSYKVTAGTSASAAKLVPHADLTIEGYRSNYVKIEPASAQAAPAAAPELASSTTSSITLKTVDPNANGAAAEYGISTDGGATWTWQDSPVFTGLTSGTEYTFAVRYGATEDGNYVASPASDTAAFSTAQSSAVVPVTPTYTPTVEETDNGTTTVSPANPSQGTDVTITPTPDAGYETAGVTVTDRNGNPVAVTDNGDGTFRFTQPVGKVTISVIYVCDGQTENCASYHLVDVDTSAWYHLAVDYVVEHGLMNGYGDGTFGPERTLSRAMVAQILYNSEGRPAVDSGSAFTDVADGAWYTDAIVWADANGVVAGYGNGLFGPNDAITREQLAVMLWHYAGSPAATQGTLAFTDADQTSVWALDAMRWTVETGVIRGSDGYLNPQGAATRAEAAQMLMNFLERT